MYLTHFFKGVHPPDGKHYHEKNGFCGIGISNYATVCAGDQGGPAIYEQDNLEYLGGIATFKLPKTTLAGQITSPQYFCGPYSGPALPAKYVKILYFVNWLLRDHEKPKKPVRMEVFDCLVNPPKNPNSIPFDIRPPARGKKRMRPKE